MQEIGFVSWEEWKPILHQFNCPCCMGVRLMPDEEELEQRINDFIQQGQEEVRKALESIGKQMNKSKGGDGD
jgi:hypothetical protein